MKRKVTNLLMLLILSTVISNAQQKKWGVSKDNPSNGMIYTLETDGNIDTVYQFKSSNTSKASSYLQLIEGANGKMYGTSSENTVTGTQGGTIFEYDPIKGAIKDLHVFSGNDGNDARGSLCLAANGKLYGLTFTGGVNNVGVIFEYDIVNSTFAKVADLDTNTTGGYVFGSFVEIGNGKLYVLTQTGGTDHMGTILMYDYINNVVQSVANFSTNTGGRPRGKLVEGANGIYYGLTELGGASEVGTLFSFNPQSNTITKLVDFNGTKGSRPRGSLTLGADSIFYGVTMLGGVDDKGVIFKYDYKTNVLTRLYSFDGVNTGASPRGSLMQASNGLFYGLNSVDGPYASGVLFEFNANGNKVDPIGYFGAGNNLVENDSALWFYNPYGTPYEHSNGMLYGAVFSGGSLGSGGIFSYNIGTVKMRREVNYGYHFNNGKSPIEGVVYDNNGNIYGMTREGGKNDLGGVFKLNTSTNQLLSVHHFDTLNGFPGGTASGKMILASNGKLYGATYTGGSYVNIQNYGLGTIFELDPVTDTYNKVYDFNGASSGAWPSGRLSELSAGKLVGTTRNGSNNNGGALFEYDIVNDTVLVLFNNFSDPISGSSPQASMPFGPVVKASNGKLYGVSMLGGTSGQGTIWSYDYANDTVTVVYSFALINGAQPTSGLTLGNDGLLYGVTGSGGANSMGTIFSLDPSNNTFTKLYSFKNTDGGGSGVLNLSADGYLYSTTSSGKVFYIDTQDGSIYFMNVPQYTIATPVHEFIEFCNKPSYVALTSSVLSPCIGDNIQVTLGSNNTNTYVWKKDGTTLISQTSDILNISNVTLADSGMYYCELTNACGTVSTDSVLVDINQSSAASLTVSATDSSVCLGASIILNATSNGSVVWNLGAQTGVSFSPLTSNTYIATATTNGNCVKVDSVQIAVNQLPSVQFTLSNSLICSNVGAYTLSGGTPIGGTYSGQGVSSNDFDPSVAGIGDWEITYTYTDNNGCVNTATDSITVDVCSGIEKQVAITPVVYPNPSKGQFNITYPSLINQDVKVEIVNSLGELVKSYMLKPNAVNNIEVAKIDAGVYFVRTITSDATSIVIAVIE